MRILVDMDGVLYDIHEPWLKLHNEESKHHQLTREQLTEWNLQRACDAAGCNIKIGKYLYDKRVWTDGSVIEGSQAVVKQWKDQGYEVGVVTAVGNSIAANRKISWLNTHFPFVDDIIITYGRNKHWVVGDILIDDGVHNLEQFSGMRVLFNQPWNRDDHEYIRAYNWNDVDVIVKSGVYLLSKNTHRTTESLLKRHLIG